MLAWRVHEVGDPADVLQLEEIDPPVPGPGQVLLDVIVAPLNFPDDLVVRGLYQERPPLPFTPGLEVLGRVAAVGGGVGPAMGTRVLATSALPAGSMAAQCLADVEDCFAVPDDVPDDAGACLHITYQTGHVALHHRARLQAGETLLVHAGAGGVGSAAIQLGVAAGARVIATAGGPDKVALCRELGADLAIDYRSDDFVEVVKDATGGHGADVVYDPVGGDVFDRSRRCIAWEGRLLVIGFTSGRFADAPTNHVLMKNYSVMGVHWGAYRHHDRSVARRAHDSLVRLYGEGRLDPLIDRQVSLAAMPDALRDVVERRSVGKVLVRP